MPIHLSPSFQKVAERGITFLKAFGEKYHVLLLHAYLVPHVDQKELIQKNDEVKRQSHEGLEALKKTLKNIVSNGNMTFETRSHLGTWENVISNVAATEKVALVLLPFGDDDFMRRISHMLERISCPLLLLPSSERRP